MLLIYLEKFIYKFLTDCPRSAIIDLLSGIGVMITTLSVRDQ